MPIPQIYYRSTPQTNCKPSGAPRKAFPVPSQSPVQFDAYALEQDFEMLLTGFQPAPKNTTSNAAAFNLGSLGDANAILTSLTTPATTGAGMGRFTANFNIVPASWDDYSTSAAFAFPGFPGLYGSTNVRDVFTDNVQVRTRYDYYVIDPANVLGGNPTSGGGVKAAATVKDSGGVNKVNTVFSAGDIPLIAKTYFVFAPGGVPTPSARTNSITPIGGINFGGTFYNQTMPSLANYQAWVSNAKAKAWQSTAWDGVTDGAGSGNGFGQLVLEDSTTPVYAGLIISRITKYILVK